MNRRTFLKCLLMVAVAPTVFGCEVLKKKDADKELAKKVGPSFPIIEHGVFQETKSDRIEHWTDPFIVVKGPLTGHIVVRETISRGWYEAVPCNGKYYHPITYGKLFHQIGYEFGRRDNFFAVPDIRSSIELFNRKTPIDKIIVINKQAPIV